jgi:hypothetical protein
MSETSSKTVVVTRSGCADNILAALEPRVESLKVDFQQSGRIPSCFVDDVLPEEWVQSIFNGA